MLFTPSITVVVASEKNESSLHLLAAVIQLELLAHSKKMQGKFYHQTRYRSQAQVQWSTMNGEDAPFNCSAKEQYEITWIENILVIHIIQVGRI